MAVERIPRLWLLRARMNLILILRTRWEGLAWLGVEILVSVGMISAPFLVATRFDGIGPWSQPQVVFLLGYAMLVNALVDMFASYNVRMISRRIARGQLDHTLLQPQPLWLSLLTEGFAPIDYALPAGIATGILAWAAQAARLPVSPGWLALLALNVAASMVVVLAIQYAWGSIAFWAPQVGEEINSSTYRMTSQLAGFPLDRVGEALRWGLLTVAPTGLIAWLPCRALLGLPPQLPFGSLLTPAASAVLGMAALWLFQRGLRHYAATGSTRYSSFGHRR